VSLEHSKKEFLSNPQTCKAHGCNRYQDSYGLCSAHYARFKKHGDVAIGGPLTSKRGKTSKRILVLDGEEINLYEAETKYQVKSSVIWLRLHKLGWTARQAVGLDEYESSTLKPITFRGN
jgi:hypothetical protein